MKTIYTIRITGAANENLWYANKTGHAYEAEKLIKLKILTMCVNGDYRHWVREGDYEILSEKIKEEYRR